MATYTPSWPITAAIVTTLRSNTSLKDAATGGIHEGVALSGSIPPLILYTVTYAPRSYDFSQHVMVMLGLDMWAYATNQVDARNIDTLIYQTLQDAPLTVSGQSILYLRRTADLESADVDEAGRKYYQTGGSYEVWSDQAP